LRRNAHWLLLQPTGLAPARLRVTSPQPRCQVWFVAPFRPRRPPSRPCSTDKSVASCRHCWQHLARYSLGLCSPSRSSRTLRSGLASATASLQAFPPLAQLPPQQLAPPLRVDTPARPRAHSHLRSNTARNPESPFQYRALARLHSSTRVGESKSTRASCPLSSHSEK